MTRGDDWFDGVDRAWREFRSALADRIAQHAETDHILWELDVPERRESPTGPYIQVSWSGPDDLVAEVSSNRVLHPRYRVERRALALLRADGWNAPVSGRANYWRTVDPAYADEAAWHLVEALRHHFDVVHPAFLVDRLAEDCAEQEAMGPLGSDDTDVHETTECLPDVVTPQDREHLVELIDQVLGADWGRPTPKRDEDGDIPYACGSAVVFVRVLPQSPTIRIFAELVVGVTDLDAAAFEVGVLNRDHGTAKFTLNNDIISMSTDLQALPLVPYHLRTALSHMCQLAENLDGVLAHRVQGHAFTESSEGDAA